MLAKERIDKEKSLMSVKALWGHSVELMVAYRIMDLAEIWHLYDSLIIREIKTRTTLVTQIKVKWNKTWNMHLNLYEFCE